MRWLRPPCPGSRFAGCRQQCSQLPIARLFLGVTLLICIVLVAVTFDPAKIEAVLVWVQENKAQGSLLFLGLYILGVVLMLPAMVMAMAAGAIFGLVAGSLVAWLGSSIGQVVAFVIGRYLLREMVLGFLTRTFPKWTAVDRAMVTEGWKMVTLLRLSPIAPWNVLNYGLAVTSVPLVPYTVASCLAILPYLIMFVYFGSLARNLADVFTGATALDTRTTVVMGAVSGVVMVAIVWYTTHISRKAVADALHSHGDELPPELTTDSDVVNLLGGQEVGEGEGGGGGSARAVHAVELASVGSGGFGAAAAAGLAGQQQRTSSPHGRRSAVHSPLAAATEGEGSVLLPLGGKTRSDDGGLHARSAHASPRSQSPMGSDSWRRFDPVAR